MMKNNEIFNIFILYMVRCFCNNLEIESFDPFNKRTNARCPSCGTLERHRFVIFFLTNTKMQFKKLLHFAPEKQLNKLFTSISKEYICGDINPARYRIPNIIRVDITSVPFKNEFDCIFASHVLEHIIEDRKAMKEIYNALAKNGRFFAWVPQRFSREETYEDASIVTEEDRVQHFGQKDHVRWYGLDFTKRLQEAGFYVKVNYAAGSEKYLVNMSCDEKNKIASEEDVIKYRFSTSDIIYECIKK